jgi:hypothetical protein
MNVHVPQARNEKLASAVNGQGTPWSMYLIPRAYCNDAIAIDKHTHTWLGSAPGRVNHGNVAYHQRLGPAANTP